MRNDQDIEAIQKILEGDREKYAVLVRRHHTNVLRMCLSLLRHPRDAEDAAQEIFIKSYRNLKSFRQDALFSTWLYRIAYRHCLDLLRVRNRRKEMSLETLIEVHGDRLEKIMAEPPRTTMTEDDKIVINQVLSDLPPEYRMILTLREIEGLSYEDIAQTMGTSLDSVKARLRRARQALMEKARHFLKSNVV